MTASDRLYAWAEQLVGGFRALGPAALAIDACLTVMWIVLAWVAAWALRKLVRFALRRLPGPSTAEKHVRIARLERLAAWVFDVAAVAVAAVAACGVWGLDVVSMTTSGAGQAVTQGALRMALVLLAAAAAIETVGYIINLAIERLAGRSSDPRRAAQLHTLGPLLRGLAQTAIGALAALMLLGDFGVRIGPLLAGAGVVGIAVGFGAQAIVRDLLTGVFLVVEDILAVGDVVKIKDSGGLVEAMTLRTIRLRDFDGTLHVIPYGEAQIVHNMTKTFSFYVFELQVSYGSDIDHALEIMRLTGAQLQADPAFKDRILAPIEVVGVDNLAESGVVLKARIKTRPIEQWNVGREYNRRIKLAFDREGVEIPYPHLTVVLPDQQRGARSGDDRRSAVR